MRKVVTVLVLLLVACGAEPPNITPPVVCGPNAAPQGAECVCAPGFVADSTPLDGCRPKIICNTAGGAGGQFNLEFPSLAEGREQTCAVYLNGKVYIVGGSAGEGRNNVRSRSVEVLDLATLHITLGPSLPEARDGHACFAYRGKLVVAGGRSGYSRYSRDVFMFDPATNEWTNGPPLQKARAWAGHAQGPDGHAYLVGGLSNPSQDGGYLDTVEEWNGSAWQNLETIPQRAFLYMAVWHQGQLLVLGGATFYNGVEYYDDVWGWQHSDRIGWGWVHHEEPLSIVPPSTLAATDRNGNSWVFVGNTFNRVVPPPQWLEPLDQVPNDPEGNCNPYGSSEAGLAYSPPDHALVLAGGQCLNTPRPSRRVLVYCLPP